MPPVGLPYAQAAQAKAGQLARQRAQAVEAYRQAKAVRREAQRVGGGGDGGSAGGRSGVAPFMRG